MTQSRRRGGRQFVPPRWVYRALWALHRAGYAISGGRLGLRSAGAETLGALELRTLGRTSGQERSVMLSYLSDGTAFAVVPSNAGDRRPPSWWLNLQAHPEATVTIPGRQVVVKAREAGPDERARLWERFVRAQSAYEAYAEATERTIPIVILEPIEGSARA